MNRLSLDVAVEFEDDKKVHIFCDARVDGRALADALKHSISIAELKKSMAKTGSYFLITCSCGDAGCGGIGRPVQVTHSAGVVEWEVPEPAPPRRYVFAANEYRSVIEGALRSFPIATAAIERAKGKKASSTPLGEETFYFGGDRAV